VWPQTRAALGCATDSAVHEEDEPGASTGALQGETWAGPELTQAAPPAQAIVVLLGPKAAPVPSCCGGAPVALLRCCVAVPAQSVTVAPQVPGAAQVSLAPVLAVRVPGWGC